MIGTGYNGSGRMGEVQNTQRNREFLLVIIQSGVLTLFDFSLHVLFLCFIA
jgi:hypothetical protein